MKKIILIIWSILLFSIPNLSSANNWSLEDILDIKYWPEVFQMEMIEFPKYSFKDATIQGTYNNYIEKMKLLKWALIDQYSQDQFTTYQMNGITSYFSNFVYHTNRMFALIKEKEAGDSHKETVMAIKKHYEQSRTFYNRLKNIIFKK